MVSDDKKPGVKKRVENRVIPMKTSSKPGVIDLIGQRLRKYYDEIADQPVPNRFMQLLDQLDEAANSKKSK